MREWVIVKFLMVITALFNWILLTNDKLLLRHHCRACPHASVAMLYEQRFVTCGQKRNGYSVHRTISLRLLGFTSLLKAAKARQHRQLMTMAFSLWKAEYEGKVIEILKRGKTGRKENREVYHILRSFAISSFAGLDRVIRVTNGKIMMTEERVEEVISATHQAAGIPKPNIKWLDK